MIIRIHNRDSNSNIDDNSDNSSVVLMSVTITVNGTVVVMAII